MLLLQKNAILGAVLILRTELFSTTLIQMFISCKYKLYITTFYPAAIKERKGPAIS